MTVMRALRTGAIGTRHVGQLETPGARRVAPSPESVGPELVGRLDEFHEHASGVFRVDEIDP